MNIITIASFNVMSHRSSNFSLPFEMDVNHPRSGEREFQWQLRYYMSVAFIYQQTADVICLQEVTPEFYSLLNDINYYLLYSKNLGLVTMVKKKFPQPEQVVHPEWKYSKIRGDTIFINDKPITIFNVHLTGDPLKRKERISILNELANDNTIIIGDFNEENLNVSKKYKIESIENVKTSYSRFLADKFGRVVKIKDIESWTNIDNVVFSPNNFFKVGQFIYPPHGLYGYEVPYKMDGSFNGWISDHAYVSFMFAIF